MRSPILVVLLMDLSALLAGARADARTLPQAFTLNVAPPLDACEAAQAPQTPGADNNLHVSPALASDLIAADGEDAADAPLSEQARPVAVEMSPAYETRARIHKWASVAMLPLFAGELYLGESLYTSGDSGTKSTHIAVGTGIVGLFALNSVTGVWNLWESRTNPAGRTRRLIHGLLMLAGDAGFAATAMTGPKLGRAATASATQTFIDNKNLHRTIAITSMSLSTAGYLVMLIGGR